MLFSLICSVVCSSAIRFMDVTGDDRQQYANVVIEGLKPGACIYLMENRDVNNRMDWKPLYVYKLDSAQTNADGTANVHLAIPDQVKDNSHYAFRLNDGTSGEVYSKPFIHKDNAWAPSRSVEAERSLAGQSSCSSQNAAGQSSYGSQNAAGKEGTKNGAAGAGKKSTGKKDKKKSKNSAANVAGHLATVAAIVVSVMVL